MKLSLIGRLSLAAILVATLAGQPARAFDPTSVPLAAQGTVQAAFAPWDNIEGLVTGAIEEASKQVLVQAYLFSSKPIAGALIRASQRGVQVRVLADAEQHAKLESSKLGMLAKAGVPVWLETAYQAAHNKIIVIDAGTRHPVVITGSYNFTWAAQHKNAENVLILRDSPALAGQYALNWERHRQDASPFTP